MCIIEYSYHVARAKAKAKALHQEAIHVSQLIVEELLNSLQLQEEVG